MLSCFTGIMIARYRAPKRDIILNIKNERILSYTHIDFLLFDYLSKTYIKQPFQTTTITLHLQRLNVTCNSHL